MTHEKQKPFISKQSLSKTKLSDGVSLRKTKHTLQNAQSHSLSYTMKDKCPTADICKLKPFTGEALIDDLSYIQAAFNSDEMLNTLLESESHPECKVTSETLYRVQTKGFRSEWRTYIAKWTFKVSMSWNLEYVFQVRRSFDYKLIGSHIFFNR